MISMMMMKTKVENMSEERQLKAELERYFTAVVDEQYQKQYPDVTSPIGTPLFYDEYGEIDADYISEMTGMSENGVKTSFDAWKSSGNVPPTEKPVAESRSARPSPLSRPKLNQVPVPERRESTSLLGGIKDDLNDVLEMRRLEHELDNVGAAGYNNYPSATHQNDLTAVITALAPLLKQDRPSIDPMTMTLMKQLNDRTQDSTAQMIALFNMNQHGRIVCCGAVSLYDGQPLAGPIGIPGLIVVKRLRMEGFIVFDFPDKDKEAENEIKNWIDKGQIKIYEDIISDLSQAPRALVGLLNGENRGKRIVEVAKTEDLKI